MSRSESEKITSVPISVVDRQFAADQPQADPETIDAPNSQILCTIPGDIFFRHYNDILDRLTQIHTPRPDTPEEFFASWLNQPYPPEPRQVRLILLLNQQGQAQVKPWLRHGQYTDQLGNPLNFDDYATATSPQQLQELLEQNHLEPADISFTDVSSARKSAHSLPVHPSRKQTS